jgi:anti-sigma regulatory factor (Ser/Thr protein kinase)
MTTATAPPLPLDESRSYWLTAPNVIDTPRLARHHVAEVLTLTGHGRLVDTARLLVSETVTNVFQHTNVPSLVVRTCVWPDQVIVSVQDSAPRWPLERRPMPLGSLADGGRGLGLLAALAAAWGVNWEGAPPEAKSVWFQLKEEGRRTGERRRGALQGGQMSPEA